MQLIDAFVPALAATRAFLENPADDYDAFRRRLLDLIDAGRQQGLTVAGSGEVDGALFAVVAWIDEAVMCSSWTHAGRWQGELLQLQYFQTTRAGVEFFRRMDELATQQKQVWEVYALCLAMGFHGRFARTPEGSRELEALRANAIQMARHDDEELLPDKLFPEAYSGNAPDGPRARRRRVSLSPFTWSVILVPALVVIILYIAYDLVLTNQVDGLIATIGK